MTSRVGNRVTDLDRKTCCSSVTAQLTSDERCRYYLDRNRDDIGDKKGQAERVKVRMPTGYRYVHGSLTSGYLEWQSFREAGTLTRIDALWPMGPCD